MLQEVNSSGPSLAIPRRSFVRVTEDEVRRALSSTSNKSAPGPSGITYKLLKWTFDANPGLIITTLNGALEHGTHPWGTADVVVIPKPHKPDYSVAKAYRPISLLECTGKLLEKIVANRLGADERNFNLIGPSQFGSRKYHSAPDAATLLRYKAEMTIRSGNVGGVLLLDISRFFDHLNPATTVATLADLGVDPSTCAWVHSFMTEHTLRLTFNGDQSDPFRQDVGVPQGSPLSPILTALYTSPILCEALSWSSQDLNLYVDDGCIYTAAPTFSTVAQQLAAAASILLSWLRRLGLTVDADKTELMFFHRSRLSPKRNGAQVETLTLSDGYSSFTVKRATWIRYLGVFLTPTLDWSLHVRTLANRARSTVRALGVLGNSI
jgi:retron-type reverse transcriptase